jgi:hypothetical protein
MKPGGGSEKGSKFERNISGLLDVWWKVKPKTFWRTEGSGSQDQPGDIAPRIQPNQLQTWFPFIVECKHYAKANALSFFLTSPKLQGILMKWWKQSIREQKDAKKLGYRPALKLVIFRINSLPILVMFDPFELNVFNLPIMLGFHTEKLNLIITTWNCFSENFSKEFFEINFKKV